MYVFNTSAIIAKTNVCRNVGKCVEFASPVPRVKVCFFFDFCDLRFEEGVYIVYTVSQSKFVVGSGFQFSVFSFQFC